MRRLCGGTSEGQGCKTDVDLITTDDMGARDREQEKRGLYIALKTGADELVCYAWPTFLTPLRMSRVRSFLSQNSSTAAAVRSGTSSWTQWPLSWKTSS